MNAERSAAEFWENSYDLAVKAFRAVVVNGCRPNAPELLALLEQMEAVPR